MSKPPTTSVLKNLDLSNDWSSHPAVEWLIEHKKIFLWFFLALLVFLIAASRYATIRTLNAENDYFQAQAAFTQFQENSASSKSAEALNNLEQLDVIMKRHPEIKPKYEGALAQTLLVSGQIPQAQAFADDIFKRTQPDYLQLYQDYSRTSLLIGAGHYPEALTQAQQLKATLDKLDADANPILYVFNLIRLALLYQQTGQPKEELQTWEELQTQPLRLEAVVAVNHTLRIGQATINQYITEREKALRNANE